MNGAHDMGGMQGMGPVRPELDEPVFHSRWEARVLAVTLGVGAMGRWNLDMSRFARENMPPADYLSRSYYEISLHGLETLLVEKGLVTPEEIDAAHAGRGAKKVAEPALTAERVGPALAKGATARLEEEVSPKFLVGQRVRARNQHPRGHTRAPRYVRGRIGCITHDHGVFIFPDSHAADGVKSPQHVYAVRFAACDLWGDVASNRDSVIVDLWDDYLDVAE